MNTPPRPSRSLAGRVAIVTGAGAKGDGIGNGRAAAILLAEAGASVVCIDLVIRDAEQTVQMIKDDGKGKATAIEAEVTKEEQYRSIVEKAIAESGRLDIPVNNVGVNAPNGTGTSVDMDQWDIGMRINVSSMVMMGKHVVPRMVKNGGQSKGCIVNLSSVAGMRCGTPNLLFLSGFYS